MQTTSIVWTQKSWNPTRGCSKKSPGCRECYALGVARRFCNTVNGKPGPYAGLVTPKGEWAGKAVMVPEHLGDPLKLRKQSLVFVNSMSDLFHETLENEDIAAIFGVMAACPRHVFQILTKRPERAVDWFEWGNILHRRGAMDLRERICVTSAGLVAKYPFPRTLEWPLPNVALGVTVEDQTRLDRIDVLKQIPAACRFVSFEPLLEIVLARVRLQGIDQAIMGCESGRHRRHTDLEVFRDLLQECDDAGCAPFVKQLEVGGEVTTDLEKFPPELRRRECPQMFRRILGAP